MKKPYHFYAVVLPGLEALAAQELQSLSAHEIREGQGGVYFSGTLDTLYRVSLRARTITRVLLRVGKCHAMSKGELQHHIARMSWGNFLDADSKLDIKASTEHSKLFHTEHIAEAVNAGVTEAIGKLGGKLMQTVYIHIQNNRCDVRIDCSGERLDRRGYRQKTVQAPIRETLAAGLLQWMDWQAEEALSVPMCGSGTFAIEAALMARRLPANARHDFPFRHWSLFNSKRWQRIWDKAQQMIREQTLNIEASDIQASCVEATRHNARQAGVLDALQISCRDIRKLSLQHEQGLMMCNPPYGLRLETEQESFYWMLGQYLKKLPTAWRIMVICPSWKHERALAMPVKRRLKVRHGGLWLEALDVTSREACSGLISN